MESSSNFPHFLKKKIVIANVFLELQTVKDLVRPLSKNHRFRTSFDSQHVKGSETIKKSARQKFFHIFSAFWGGLIRKISPLLNFEIIGVFVNTLTADYKYRVPDSGNLPLSVQMQLP